ncbi:MAG: hypothetical protein COT71_04445 [Candidatus Andersenbacteria bacterium CG10_big_fil_rev_8_21_14_0_10_54_11]|uniref:DedA family protein n=1 Tax=Candidatus Andersenbacteria bacterium CG10_big_fil_rev_8_21_14_0_10_54_11 TaxID=1974485 RepID=A0A2M6WY76_9BACT|nr:MAG: hypothetical protein COT71_04445 [Candidatus Andersenbacteria bacterium CG10_big_fil_rev_8_21_14_0_10_54_11]
MWGSTVDITSLLMQYRYGLLFPSVVVEGPVATITAGLLVAHGYMGFTASYIVAAAADVAADVGYYLLGAAGETHLTLRWQSRLGLTPARLADVRAHFKCHGGTTFLAGKLLHGPGIAVLVAAGAAHVRFTTFLTYTVAITVVKTLALLLLGYYFGYALGWFRQWLDAWVTVAAGVSIVLSATYLVRRRRRKNQ